ncbi:phosphotransferase-like protein [Propionibacteriaceae bacterium Y2011]
MVTTLILDGSPASGKSAVARALQVVRHREHNELCLHVQLDVFEGMMPRGVALGAADFTTGVQSMLAAVRALAEGNVGLIVELVARNDASVRQIISDLLGQSLAARPSPIWVTLLAGDAERSARNRARGSERTVPTATELDPRLVASSRLVMRTDEHTVDEVVLAIDRILGA